MDESPKPAEAAAHPLQGPHRTDFADQEGTEGTVPLRLTLQPKGPSVVLRTAIQVLGRHSDCDVRMPLPDVSRRHCKFFFENGHWDVIDLNSLNGLYVNGKRVNRVRLHSRDRIQVGGMTLEVTLLGERPAKPPGNNTKVLQSIADALPQTADSDQPERRQAS